MEFKVCSTIYTTAIMPDSRRSKLLRTPDVFEKELMTRSSNHGQPECKQRKSLSFEQYEHLNVLQRVCTSKWSDITANIKECITNPSRMNGRHNINGSSSSLPAMCTNRGNLPVQMHTAPCQRKDLAIQPLRRCLSENAKTCLRLQHATNTSDNATQVVLPPFQATSDFRRESPAYWINHSYIYDEVAQKLDIVIRQTGVISDKVKFSSKLVMFISFTSRDKHHKKKMQKVTLRRSRKDNSFMSSKVSFFVDQLPTILDSDLKFEIYSESFLRGKKLAMWTITLSDCTTFQPKLHFHKVEFFQ